MDMVRDDIEDKIGEIDFNLPENFEDTVYVVSWASKIWARFRTVEGIEDYSLNEIEILSSTCDEVTLDCGITMSQHNLREMLRLMRKLSRESNGESSDRVVEPDDQEDG